MNRTSRQKNYSFAQLLGGLLLLVLLISMSLIAIVSSIFTRRSVEELSNRIVAQSLARVELRIDALLQQAMTQNAQGERLLSRGQLAADDFKRLGGFFAGSLEGLNDLTYLGLGRETNGDYLFAERISDNTIRVREYVVDESGKRVVRDWRWLHAERELVKVLPWDGYDPRQRPFYQIAVAARTNTWTDTYMFWKGNERGSLPGVTCATPFYDNAGKLAGVLNSDFDLDALCKFLAEVRRDMSGYPFVVEQRRDGSLSLIAHPDPTVLKSGSESTSLADVRDRKAAAFVQSVLADVSKRQALQEGRSVLFEADGEKLFGNARQLNRANKPRWIVAVIIPVREVMGSVYRNDRRALAIGLSCLALTALLALHMARRIGRPLQQLTQEAQAIRRLDLSGKTDATSRIDEVAKLASSMSEMKSSLRSFQKFVPVDVVRDIVSTASEAQLGGERATLTLFFSDVADFTSLAEAMSPEKLVEYIGEYLGTMSEVIHAGRGTVDKFIGDGIMAFWGAPRANAGHARDACETALAYQRALGCLCERWRQAGKPVMRARIGLHTGPAIVGNIGSESRLNYTAIGDSVNLTSRIEGLNKFYGTEIIISAACGEAAGDAIVTRPIDHVSVKGRTGGIVVHELLGMTHQTDDETRRFARLTAEAFEIYQRGDFDAARGAYQGVLALRPTDPVASMLVKRCQELAGSPRPSEWDTTFHMKEK